MVKEFEKESFGQTETSWKNTRENLENASFLTAGIDVGSLYSKAVILADGQVYAYAVKRMGSIIPGSAQKVFGLVLDIAGIPADRIDYCVGIGYGRAHIPFADRILTEVACLARGGNFLYGPQLGTVVDVGGQDIKVIHCDNKGRVINFIISDKCAAGTGIGVETFARLLEIPITEAGELSLQIKEEPPAISDPCVAFARGEAMALLHKGWPKEQIMAAYCKATAEKIFSIIERAGLRPQWAVTGGIGKNRGVVERITRLIQLEPLKSNWDTHIAGALGAALFAYALCLKGKARRKEQKGA